MSAKLFILAWRVVGRIPEALVRTVAMAASDVIWLRRGKGVARLESNLRRVRPGVSKRHLRRISRMGMRAYTRYYVDAFRLRSFSDAQIRARCRIENRERLDEVFASGKSAVLALGHIGNWDLAGAYAALEIAPVTTVAERLNPPELYDAFVEFRESLGMELFALGDEGVVRGLLAALRRPPRIVPLLMDRDLSHNGVEVEFFGEPARMAKGPAVIALAGRSPLFPVTFYHERLRGAARRAAGSPWGMVLVIHPEVQPEAAGQPERDLKNGATNKEQRKPSRDEQIKSMIQRCADTLAIEIEKRPWEWHMLQRVFTADFAESARLRWAESVSNAEPMEHG